MKYVLLMATMVLVTLGQLSLKKGVSLSHLEPNFSSIIKTIFNPYVLLGFLLYGASSIAWLFVLLKIPLSIAYPARALTFIIIVLASYLFLEEPLTMQKIAGTILILIGVFVLFK